MEMINKFKMSLGKEPYDVLGFDSEDQLEQELFKLIQVRKEFKSYKKIGDE